MNYPALHLFHSAKVHIKFEITNIFYIKRIFDKPFYLLTKTAGIPLLHTHTRARTSTTANIYRTRQNALAGTDKMADDTDKMS